MAKLHAATRIWDDFEDELVFFACYADPPAVSDGGLITLPHSWSSSAVEKAIGKKLGRVSGRHLRSREVTSGSQRIVNAAWDEEGGLAIVIQTHLRKVIGTRGYSNQVQAWRVSTSSICAHIEYMPVVDSTYALIQAKDCVLTGFMLMNGGGCNPGAQIYFPGAPRFSAFLRRYLRSYLEGEDEWQLRAFTITPHLTPTKVRRLFPDRKGWGANTKLERLFLNCEWNRASAGEFAITEGAGY